MDERKWMQAIQKGNKEPLRDIAERYYADVYRFCAFQTGSREEAYDLAQETFLRFIRYVDNYRERNLKGYLLTIAMNLCRDYHRKKIADSAMLTPEPYEESWQEDIEAAAETPAPESSFPEQQILRKEITEQLLKALKMLPEVQREALLLHFFYNLKYREIAQLTGSQISTVKSRIRQGTEKLSRILDKEDFLDA